jgi:tetratricopeptide (TPR) repeat protein
VRTIICNAGLLVWFTLTVLPGWLPAQTQEDQIITTFKKALELNPRDNDIRHKLASAYYERMMFSEAIIQYETILTYDPNDGAAYYNMGLLYYHQQDLSRALQNFTKAQQLNPQDDNLCYVTGMCYLAQQDYPRAIDMMKRAVKINPDNLDAKINLANAHAHHSQFTEAVTLYKEVLKRIGDDQFVKQNLGSALYNVGLEHFLKEDFKTSLGYLRESFAYVEDKQQGILLAANCEFNLANYIQAIQDYQQVLRLDNRNVDAHYYTGCSYMQLDSLNQALTEFDEVLVLDPVHKKAIKYKAQVLDELFSGYMAKVSLAYKEKKYITAFQQLKKAEELAPKNESVKKYRKLVDKKIKELMATLVRQGEKAYAQKDYAQSYQKYQALLELDPGWPGLKGRLDSVTVKLNKMLEPLYAEATAAIQQGRHYQAIRRLRNVLLKKPDYPDAQTLLNACQDKLNAATDSLYDQALAAFSRKEYQQAGDIFDKILEINPEYVDNTGRMQKTRNKLKSIMQERRQKISALTDQGIALFKKGRFLEAQGSFQQILDLDSDNSEAQVYLNKCQTELARQLQEYLARGNQQYNARKYTAALEAFGRVLKIKPTHPEAATKALRCRSRLLLQEGQQLAQDQEYHQAIKKLQRSVELDRSHAPSQKALQQTLAARDQAMATSLKIGNQHLKDNQLRDAEKVFTLILEKYQEDHPEATQNLDKIKALRTSQANQARIDEYYSQGVDYYTQGEYQKAVAEWNKVLDLQPDHQKAQRNIENARKKLDFYQQEGE